MGRTAPKRKQQHDPNRPKRPTSAYFYFMAQERMNAKAKGKSITKVAEWTKEVSAIWRDLSGKDRAVFDKQAAKDKERYEDEMAAYKGTTRKPEGQPKKPQTSYFLFLAKFRTENKDKYEDNKELLRAAGKGWKSLTASQRQPYEKMASEEKRKYNIAMKAFNEKEQGGKKMKITKSAATVDDDDDDEEDDDEDDDDEEDESPAKNGTAANADEDDDDDEDESEEEEDDE